MIQTVEAIIDDTGHIVLLGEIHFQGTRRALVTVLEESPPTQGEPALLAEPALAEDWNRPEEDTAWSYLQQEK